MFFPPFSRRSGFRLRLNLGCNTPNNSFRSLPSPGPSLKLGKIVTWQTPSLRICNRGAHLFVVRHEYEYHLTHLTAAASLQGDLHVSHIKLVFRFQPADGARRTVIQTSGPQRGGRALLCQDKTASGVRADETDGPKANPAAALSFGDASH